MAHAYSQGGMEGNRGLVFSIQRYSIHDGPGIRTTIFMKGCPLTCRWCSNPESLNRYPELMVRGAKCNRCGKCLDVCRGNAITLNEQGVQVDRARCDLCMKCVDACGTDVFEGVGSYLSVDEAVEECSKDEPFYRNSGGGVTVSGGEPLFQAEFVTNLLRECKNRALHTALDTSGYASWEVMGRVLEYTDLVLFDLKHLDVEMHRNGTGVRNGLILENLERIIASGRAMVWVRVPIIPGYNDSEQYVEGLADYLKTRAVEKISLLGYHEWGRQKYQSLGRPYLLDGCLPPSQERLQGLAEVLHSRGLQATVGH